MLAIMKYNIDVYWHTIIDICARLSLSAEINFKNEFIVVEALLFTSSAYL